MSNPSMDQMFSLMQKVDGSLKVLQASIDNSDGLETDGIKDALSQLSQLYEKGIDFISMYIHNLNSSFKH